jgi:short-subunit dehydrogenase
MKRTIITGGSSGLGYELAKHLVKERQLVLIGRSEDKLTDAKERLLTLHPSADIKTHSFDISDEPSVVECLKTYECIDELYNVAGVGIFKTVTDYSKEDMMNVLNANLVGMMLMTKETLKIMTKGVVINVISTAGLKGKVGESVYCASKFGARGYTEALKATYKGTDIKIIGVYPGGMNTSFWSKEKENFMSAKAVAKQIIRQVKTAEHMNVTDITIERW